MVSHRSVVWVERTVFALAFFAGGAVVGCLGVLGLKAKAAPTVVEAQKQAVADPLTKAPPLETRNPLRAFVDPVTGCEYVGWLDSAITPRLHLESTGFERVRGCRRPQ